MTREEIIQDGIDGNKIAFIDESDVEKMFIEGLNEQGLIYIGSIGFEPADVLKEMDPIGYDQGIWDSFDYDMYEEYDNGHVETSEVDNYITTCEECGEEISQKIYNENDCLCDDCKEESEEE